MNPQLENGHTRIANEIMDALAGIRIPGQARQVLDVIIRKTYGWQKKTDKISLSQFAESTGMTKVTVSKAINKLLKMNLITKEGSALSCFTKKGNDYSIIYGLQKDYGKWLPLPKKVTLPKKVKNVTQKGIETLPKMSTTKDINKNTHTKERKIKLHSFGNRRSLVLSNPDLDICKHFLDYIKVNHPNKVNSIVGLKKPKEDWQVYEVWLNDMRLLNNRGYDRNKILKAMEKAINDDFWRDNFYSISKLNRKNKYDIYFIDVFLDIKIKQTKVQKSQNALKEWLDENDDL